MSSKTDKPGLPAAPAAMPGRRGRRTSPDDPIAAALRRMWADAEQEPVPEDLLALLDRIDTASGLDRNVDQDNSA